jgi:hypothetical protein
VAYSHVMARRGTNNVTLRLEEELWAEFGDVAGERERSGVLREFIRWYTRQPGAKMPRRP